MASALAERSTNLDSTETSPIIELKDVHMSFGRVNVLKGVSLAVRRGEVVALVGDNGAGKSTLIKIITGVHRPVAGEVVIKGEPVTMTSVQDSRQRGIETVYQERP